VEHGRVAACALAEEGDLLAVAAKVGDVVADPLDGKDLVLEADVDAAGVEELRGGEEAQSVEAILQFFMPDGSHAITILEKYTKNDTGELNRRIIT
jgi:hypothetical protein